MEVGKTLSAEEQAAERQRAAEKAGDVIDVDNGPARDVKRERAVIDVDALDAGANASGKRVKRERAPEPVALTMHASFNPTTKAHTEMFRAAKTRLERDGRFEVKEFVFATTRDERCAGKGRYLRGADRRRLASLAAAEAGLDRLGLVQVVDGSDVTSGSAFVTDVFVPSGDWRGLKVERSDTATHRHSHRKEGLCVVVMGAGDSEAAVYEKRPGAVIVDRLTGALGDLTDAKVRNALDRRDAVVRMCGEAVAAALESMTWHEGDTSRRCGGGRRGGGKWRRKW